MLTAIILIGIGYYVGTRKNKIKEFIASLIED